VKWEVYKISGSVVAMIGGSWIVQPPGADFEASYAFPTFREAWRWAGDPAWRRHVERQLPPIEAVG
jgi:hypothetical protein